MCGYKFIRDICCGKYHETHRKKLYQVGEDYVLASQVHDVKGGIIEVLIFESNEEGEILNWIEIDGYSGWSDIRDVMDSFVETGGYREMASAMFRSCDG